MLDGLGLLHQQQPQATHHERRGAHQTHPRTQSPNWRTDPTTTNPDGRGHGPTVRALRPQRHPGFAINSANAPTNSHEGPALRVPRATWVWRRLSCLARKAGLSRKPIGNRTFLRAGRERGISVRCARPSGSSQDGPGEAGLSGRRRVGSSPARLVGNSREARRRLAYALVTVGLEVLPIGR